MLHSVFKFGAGLAGLTILVGALLSFPGILPVGADAGMDVRQVSHDPWGEVVMRPDIALATPQLELDQASVLLERVSTAVPWPRGLVFAEDRLVVLARGRHRRSGGVSADIQDQSGTLYEVDPSIAETVVPGGMGSSEVAGNGRVLAAPTAPPFFVWDRKTAPAEDFLMDRPYCTLIHDPASDNYFICGYSGVDLPGGVFRKNATDTVHRYDGRTGRWSVLEKHDPTVVPRDEISEVIPNQYYPHHDPQTNPAPHGWLNGADGGTVVGQYLYVVAKDNHCLVQYDLTEIRNNPEAGPPGGKPVFGANIDLKVGDEWKSWEVLGHSACVANNGYLYVAFRTSSLVIRVPLSAEGDVILPVRAELIAEFEPWNAEKKESGNIIDLAFNSKGELFVSAATRGRVWNVGVPDPNRVFDGDDGRADSPTQNRPFVDLPSLTGKAKARSGNITFDDRDRLYVCSGNYDDAGTGLAGVIYRATSTD